MSINLEDEEFDEIIDKVAKFNKQLVPIQQSSNISSRSSGHYEDCERESGEEEEADFDDEDDDEISSIATSINSIDKQLMCENYIKNNQIGFGGDNAKKQLKRSTKAETKPNSATVTSRMNGKTTTPPAQVLATINKWLNETKKVIESRNKEIIRRKNFT